MKSRFGSCRGARGRSSNCFATRYVMATVVAVVRTRPNMLIAQSFTGEAAPHARLIGAERAACATPRSGADETGGDVDRQREDAGVEEERHHRLREHEPSHRP